MNNTVHEMMYADDSIFKIPYKGTYQINLVLIATVQVSVSVMIGILNIAIMIAIMKSRNRGTPKMVLIFHNSLTDFILGVFLLTLYVPLLILAAFGISI